MAKIILVYASMSGNTEVMALEIAKGIREAGEEVEVMEAFETDASILSNYDGILIGTYTWGDGDLPDELLDFHDELHDLDLTGKYAAVFGSFDWSYMDGGIAVDKVRDTLQKRGAEIVLEDLKVELDPAPEERVQCKNFGIQFVKEMLKIF
ncbi:MAG TPA: flavodoxin [Bacillales bacterium]|nr:flavodoxin [Bacillales bacterium]